MQGLRRVLVVTALGALVAPCAALGAASPPVFGPAVKLDGANGSTEPRVTITPETFGVEPTEGELIAATRTHYSLRRHDARAGAVHVHFPRIGYVLRAAQA